MPSKKEAFDGPERQSNNAPRVTEQATEDDKDVINVVLLEDRVRDLFGGRHGLADRSDVSCRLQRERCEASTRTVSMRKINTTDRMICVPIENEANDILLFHVLLSTSVGRSAMPAIW